MDKNLESFKQAAYFNYFRTFSMGTMNTIKKLQLEFRDEINESYSFDSNSMLKRVKNLLNSYEVLILQINDSFEFMEVPLFGECILKIFLKMMSVIKWLLKCMSVRIAPKQLSLKKDEATQTLMAPPTDKQKQLYRTRERAFFLLEDIQQDLSRMEEQHKEGNKLVSANQRTLNRQKFLSIKPSDSEVILEQAMHTLTKNGQNLYKFVEFRSKLLNQNEQLNNLQQFSNIRQYYRKQCDYKINQVKNKLHSTFVHYLSSHQNNKKQSMVDSSCQVKMMTKSIVDQPKQQKQHKNVIKKLNDNIRALQSQLKIERDQVQMLKNMIQIKTQQLEEQNMQIRTQKIINDSKYSMKSIDVSPTQQHQHQQQQQQQLQQLFKSEKQTKAVQTTQITNTEPNHYTANFRKPNRKKIFKTPKRVNFEKKQQSESLHMSNNRTQNNLKINNQNIFVKYVPDKKSQKKIRSRQISSFNQKKQTISSQHKSGRVKSFASLSQKDQQIFKEQDQLNIPKQQIYLKLKSNVFQICLRGIKLTKRPQYLQKMIYFNQKRLNHQNQQSNIKITEKIFTQSQKTKVDYNITDYTKNQKNGNENDEKQYGSKKSQKNINLIKNHSSHIKIFDKKEDFSLILKHDTCQIQGFIVDKNVIEGLFFNEQNAKSYEYLNVNSQFAKKHISPHKRVNIYSSGLKIGYKKTVKDLQAERNNHLISIMMKQLNNLKKTQRSIYYNIRTFLRYPFSSLNQQKHKNWSQMQKQQPQIQFYQLRKQINRILRIHNNCGSQNKHHFCEHIIQFCKKLGIVL